MTLEKTKQLTYEKVAEFAISTRKGIPKHPIPQTSKYDVDGVLHHDVHFIFATDVSRLQQSETWRIRRDD